MAPARDRVAYSPTTQRNSFHNVNITPVLVGAELAGFLGPMGSFLVGYRAGGDLDLVLGLVGRRPGLLARSWVTSRRIGFLGL